MATRMSTTRVRQGRSGKPVLWVLGISTVAAAAVLFGAWAMRSDDLAVTQPTPRQNTESPPPAR